jgi:hypothetical protein
MPTRIIAERFTSICGVMDPPFMNGDLYSLYITGNMAQSPYPGFTVDFSSPAVIGIPIMPTVQPFSAQTSGIGQPDGGIMWYAGQTANGGGIDFRYSLGSDPSEIDTGAFDSVTVTILAMPSKDGDPLTIRILIHFVDGKVLDETFSSPLETAWSGCPRG